MRGRALGSGPISGAALGPCSRRRDFIGRAGAAAVASEFRAYVRHDDLSAINDRQNRHRLYEEENPCVAAFV